MQTHSISWCPLVPRGHRPGLGAILYQPNCRCIRRDIKRIETVANNALLILAVRLRYEWSKATRNSMEETTGHQRRCCCRLYGFVSSINSSINVWTSFSFWRFRDHAHPYRMGSICPSYVSWLERTDCGMDRLRLCAIQWLCRISNQSDVCHPVTDGS